MSLGGFNPRTVLRQTTNGLLDELFGRMEVPMRLNWSDLAEMDVDPMFEAYQSLDDNDHDRAEVMLRDLHLMTGEEAQRVVFQQIKQAKMDDLLAELEQLESRYDCAAIAYLEAPQAYQAAMRFSKADRVIGGRSSQRRVDVPAAKPRTSPEALSAFANAISAYYSARQGRGRHCHVEYSMRRPGLHYLFVSLDDYLRRGYEVVEAAARGGADRLRPILSTSITTIIGLIPLALSDAMWEPLCFAIIFGLIASTILSLAIIPAMYVLLTRPYRDQFIDA